MERLSQLRRLSDVRIRSFYVGRPKVTPRDLCAKISAEMDASRSPEWSHLIGLPANRIAEIRLQASRLTEDSLGVFKGEET